MFQAARTARVLENEQLGQIRPFLEGIRPMPAVFDQHYVKRLCGANVKKGKNKRDLAEQLRADIQAYKKITDRQVVIWCGSTEIFLTPAAVHQTVAAFEKGLEENDENISPSMIYAYAALQEGVAFANGAPNLTVDLPVMQELSKRNNAPICGKDFKTGQTLLKTVLAPAFKARMLGVSGWYSTNILGNRDGEVLDDPESFKTKEESKLGVLDFILQPDLYPDLYKDIYHKVRINYYPPRGDNKEGWDNIDIFGWLGYPMQIKVDFLCRDSILAAPIALDLVLFMDLASRTPELRGPGHSGVAQFLLQIADDRRRPLPGARPLYSVDEAQEHVAAHHGRNAHHPPRSRILRLAHDSLLVSTRSPIPSRLFLKKPHLAISSSAQ